ncbi:hypothetical protein BVRB_7g175920 [Beta vulgaris subsp. vulgaris]|nr:hypothetical protein BVRB_7g175920 [Beta vulgaris subsp. vulgaris]
MRTLLVIFLVVFLQLQFLLLTSKCFNIDLEEHNYIKGREALPEHGLLHITSIGKKAGGGGGGGGGRGGGRGGSGGRGGGRGRIIPIYGAAGAAAASSRSHQGHNHHKGAASVTTKFGITLPSLLLGVGIYFIQ